MLAVLPHDRRLTRAGPDIDGDGIGGFRHAKRSSSTTLARMVLASLSLRHWEIVAASGRVLRIAATTTEVVSARRSTMSGSTTSRIHAVTTGQRGSVALVRSRTPCHPFSADSPFRPPDAQPPHRNRHTIAQRAPSKRSERTTASASRAGSVPAAAARQASRANFCPRAISASERRVRQRPSRSPSRTNWPRVAASIVKAVIATPGIVVADWSSIAQPGSSERPIATARIRPLKIPTASTRRLTVPSKRNTSSAPQWPRYTCA
jgi:hypothetical protein